MHAMQLTDPFGYAKAMAVMAGYKKRWETQAYNVVGVEVEFRHRLINPDTGRPSPLYDVGGKIDAIAVDQQGWYWVVEHKTSSLDFSPGSSYWKRLAVDRQVGMYIEAGTHLGYDIAGCLYDVIGRPALKPYKAGKRRERDETPGEYQERVAVDIEANPDKYYQRQVLYRTEAQRHRHRKEMWSAARKIRRDELAGYDTDRNSGSCTKWGSLCVYGAVCGDELDIYDEDRFPRGQQHPELDGTNNQPKDS